MAYESPSVSDLRVIIDTGMTDQQLRSVITDAELLVGRCIAGMDDDRAATIVKYVAADLIAASISGAGAGVVTSSKLGDATDTFSTGVSGQSAYWLRALQLDDSGCIASLGKRPAMVERV